MNARKVKTATFRLGKYRIGFVTRIDGVTDRPDLKNEQNVMLIPDGNDLRCLHAHLHEAQEANGKCEMCLHGKPSAPEDPTWAEARFLWRLGWRRTG